MESGKNFISDLLLSKDTENENLSDEKIEKNHNEIGFLRELVKFYLDQTDAKK